MTVEPTVAVPREAANLLDAGARMAPQDRQESRPCSVALHLEQLGTSSFSKRNIAPEQPVQSHWREARSPADGLKGASIGQHPSNAAQTRPPKLLGLPRARNTLALCDAKSGVGRHSQFSGRRTHRESPFRNERTQASAKGLDFNASRVGIRGLGRRGRRVIRADELFPRIKEERDHQQMLERMGGARPSSADGGH